MSIWWVLCCPKARLLPPRWTPGNDCCPLDRRCTIRGLRTSGSAPPCGKVRLLSTATGACLDASYRQEDVTRYRAADHEQPLAPTSGFFTGSLFDAPLPIQSQAAPARVQQPSLFSSDSQRSWSPMPPTSAGNGAKQDWLGDLFGGAAASSSCDSRAAQKPEEQRMDIWTRGYRGLQSRT